MATEIAEQEVHPLSVVKVVEIAAPREIKLDRVREIAERLKNERVKESS
jgi:hypothetical protein